MTRLRPEQVAGGVPVGLASRRSAPAMPWLVRFVAFTSRNDFVRRYGDTGEDEFEPRAARSPSGSC